MKACPEPSYEAMAEGLPYLQAMLKEIWLWLKKIKTGFNFFC
jgi:hypothetical protein